MSGQAAHFLQGSSREGRTIPGGASEEEASVQTPCDGNQRRVSLGSSGLAGAKKRINLQSPGPLRLLALTGRQRSLVGPFRRRPPRFWPQTDWSTTLCPTRANSM